MTGLFAAAEPADQRVAGFFSALFTGADTHAAEPAAINACRAAPPRWAPRGNRRWWDGEAQTGAAGVGPRDETACSREPAKKGDDDSWKKGRIMEFAAHPPKRGSCDLVQSFDHSPKTPLATPARPSCNANPVAPGKHYRQRECHSGVLPRARERFSHGSTAKRQNKQPAKADAKRSSAHEHVFRVPCWSGFAAPAAWQRRGSRSARSLIDAQLALRSFVADQVGVC